MEAAQNYAVESGGRVIAGSGVGILLDKLGQGSIQDFLWGALSKVWAYGAISGEEDIDAFIYSGGKVWQTVEMPLLWSADGFTRLLEPAKQIIFHLR